MQITEMGRDLRASLLSLSLEFENSGGYSLSLAVNLVTLEHGFGESLEGFVLRQLKRGLKEKERRCLNAQVVPLHSIPDSVLPPSLTRSTRSFLPISNKTYLEQRLMRISSAVRYGKRLRVGGHAAKGATVMSDVGSMVDCLFILFLGFDYCQSDGQNHKRTQRGL